MKKKSKTEIPRWRKFYCPACKKYFPRFGNTKTVGSFCEATGRDVRMRRMNPK